MNELSLNRRILILAGLVFAGEMIFSLPFHIARFFRPTFLAAFELSNAQLGDIFAVYGVLAMLAYFPGGLLADRFSARSLITVSLLATAAGGLYLAQFPGPLGLSILFGYWGATTIFLFWAAVMKTTRIVGGDRLQGRAFGLLDGGRGLVAAAMVSALIFLLGSLLSPETVDSSIVSRRQAIEKIIYFYTTCTVLAALFVWLLIPARLGSNEQNSANIDLRELPSALKGRGVAWISIIVVCAYCGYKGVDNYGLYAVGALGMSELDAARFTSWIAYMRPVAAILAGVFADRFSATRVILIGFAAMTLAYAVLFFYSSSELIAGLLVMNLFLSVAGVFAVRGVYFALFHEARVPTHVTGTAVGLVSVLGFTPDIFFAPVAGRILDAAPGAPGLQDYFLLLSVIAVIGLIATLMLQRTIARSSYSKRPDGSAA